MTKRKPSTRNATRWQIFTAAEPTVTRIIPPLAAEIGLNESIVLLQIAYWINATDNAKDGAYWTYQSLRKMQEEAFPYWSIETIRRAINNLANKGYILVRNYNRRQGDNTQWFALEPDKLSSLTSVLVAPLDRGVSNRDTLSQNETPTQQNETTLPETTTETTHRLNTPLPPKGGKSSKSRIPKTDLEAIFRAEYAQYESLAEALRDPFNELKVPAPITAREELIPYLDAAKQLTPCGATVDEIPHLYTYVKKRAAREQWTTFGVKALVKHYNNFKAQYRPAPAPIEEVEFVAVLEQAARDRVLQEQES